MAARTGAQLRGAVRHAARPALPGRPDLPVAVDGRSGGDVYTATSAVAHMTHQVLARTTAKTEYILGLVILRKLGASGLLATPTEADVTGPAAADIDEFLQAATLPAADRVRLFRLAWDTCVSAFAGRQALYEYYFFGDPVRMAGAYAGSYDTSPYADRVRDFLRRR